MIALLGKTCAGKNTVKDELLKLGYKDIVTYTTRPMRPGEKDGVTYHYISNTKFFFLKLFGFFAETTSYKVADGQIWRYGTSKKSLSTTNGVIILNPNGHKAIKKLTSLNNNDWSYFSVLLDISPLVQRKRLIQRGDSKKESDRRINADANDFIGMRYEVDYVVQNDEAKTPQEIAKMIHRKYVENEKEKRRKNVK